MRADPIITMDEWLDAVWTAKAPPPGSFTIADLMKAGLTRASARTRIEQGLRTGELKYVASSMKGAKYYLARKISTKG
jgi:hypothetical protein